MTPRERAQNFVLKYPNMFTEDRVWWAEQLEALIYGQTANEWAHNARLISAAPDLLEALEIMLNSKDYYKGRQKAFAAISKAKGE